MAPKGRDRASHLLLKPTILFLDSWLLPSPGPRSGVASVSLPAKEPYAVLDSLRIERFKSIENQEIRFPRLTVLFGPNAAGKSNILDAIQVLSRLGTNRTLTDALSGPIRGNPIEAFAFPDGGLAELYKQSSARFSLDAVITAKNTPYNYKVEVCIEPKTGSLYVGYEYLSTLQKRSLEPKGAPRIETVGDEIIIRSRQGRPRKERVDQNHTKLSDTRLGGAEYSAVAQCRQELERWRVYYLDPRTAMRTARPPAEVSDIGLLGEDLAPFLYRLQVQEPSLFGQVKRTLRSIIPSVEDLKVELDERRGLLDVGIRQDGKLFSSRIVSEGTLRIIALCAIATNPWSGSLVAFEEPENGVHPKRIELVAKLINSMATEARQVVVTSHSPLFCAKVIESANESNRPISLLSVSSAFDKTRVKRIDPQMPLFRDELIRKHLADPLEDSVLEDLMKRGLLDADTLSG